MLSSIHSQDMSCSSLPEDCVCPCTEDITDENYNACDESFSDLR